MEEQTLQIISSLKLVWIAGFSLLYGLGGIRGKYKRRIIGALYFTLGICLFSLWTGSFSWWYLLTAPLLYGGLSIGYGAVVTSVKILKRARYGLACALASLPIFIVNGAYTLLALHIILVTGVSVVAGVWNQTSSARSEETLIGTSIVLIPFFII